MEERFSIRLAAVCPVEVNLSYGQCLLSVSSGFSLSSLQEVKEREWLDHNLNYPGELEGKIYSELTEKGV